MAKRGQAVRRPPAGRKGPTKSKISSPKIKSEGGGADLRRELAQARRELAEARQQQTATAEVLKVISRSAFDLQPVLDTIVQTASRLCDAEFAQIFKVQGDKYDLAATTSTATDFVQYSSDHPLPPGRGSLVGRTVLDRKTVHLPDCLADPEYKALELQKLGRFRSILGVPLLREGVPIGVIVLMRAVVLPFTDKQIELVSTFADQAVIAIENARLFDEVQAKTRDLSEALVYQTGSGNILKVIASSPTDAGPVLKAIVESACELCDAYDAVVLLKDGDSQRMSAHHGPIPIDYERWPLSRKWVAGRAFLDRKPVHVHDLLSTEGDEFPDTRQRTARTGTRSILSVPLLREGESIGTIVLRRTEVHPFSDKQISLLQTFADQAVIAIGNVQLFDEVQAKTRDLTEALTYQTGSSNILSVIASSPTDVGPVLKAIVESACEICDANDAAVLLKAGEDLRPGAHHGPIPVRLERWPVNRNSVTGRCVIDRVPVHVHDVLSREGAEFPLGQEMSRRDGFRSILSVPLLREGESIGAIALRRAEVHPFSDKQVALLQTFADQAVIAIENARLFNETQKALERQTATADILKVIASSPDDVQPVFEAIAASANRLVGGFSCTVVRFIEGTAYLKAFTPTTQEADEILQASFPQPVAGFAPFQAAQVGGVTQVPDTESMIGKILDISRARGFRSMLFAPLVNNGETIGAIGVTRVQPGSFADHHVQLLKTFADQAVIAIQNVHLFDQLQRRTDDLSESLQQQTATSEVLPDHQLVAGRSRAGVRQDAGERDARFVAPSSGRCSSWKAMRCGRRHFTMPPRRSPLHGSTRSGPFIHEAQLTRPFAASKSFISRM